MAQRFAAVKLSSLISMGQWVEKIYSYRPSRWKLKNLFRIYEPSVYYMLAPIVHWTQFDKIKWQRSWTSNITNMFDEYFLRLKLSVNNNKWEIW